MIQSVSKAAAAHVAASQSQPAAAQHTPATGRGADSATISPQGRALLAAEQAEAAT